MENLKAEAEEKAETGRRTGTEAEKKKADDRKYSYFSHKECEYFPCHAGADPENFNCLFCYCPLYALGKDCGGNFIITAKGRKDCTNCQIPHRRENYDYIIGKYNEVAEIVKTRL